MLDELLKSTDKTITLSITSMTSLVKSTETEILANIAELSTLKSPSKEKIKAVIAKNKKLVASVKKQINDQKKALNGALSLFNSEAGKITSMINAAKTFSNMSLPKSPDAVVKFLPNFITNLKTLLNIDALLADLSAVSTFPAESAAMISKIQNSLASVTNSIQKLESLASKVNL